MGDDRPSVYVQGAEVYYRASALGSCTRALAAARQELDRWTGDAPASIQKAYDAGNDAEEWMVGALRELGVNVKDQQREVVLALTPKLRIIGHLDGIANLDDRDTLLEIKRQNDDEFKADSITASMWWYKYRYQLSSYMIATGLPATVYRVRDDRQYVWETFTAPPVSQQDLMARVMEVERMARGDLATAECDRKDFPCPYWKVLHPGRGDDGVERYDVDDAELAAWIVHYARVKGDAAELVKVEKSLRGRILERVKMGITRDRETGVAVKVTQSVTGQRTVAGYTMTRVTPILPSAREGDEENGGDDDS